MAVSFYYDHYGLLNRYPIRMLESPWRFNGFVDTINPNRVKARKGVWQQRHRESLAESISISYNEMADYLGYNPSPKWSVDEIIPFRKTRGFQPSREVITLPKRRLIQFGKPTYNIVPTARVEKSKEKNPLSILIKIKLESSDIESLSYLRNKYYSFLRVSPTDNVSIENRRLSHNFERIIEESGKTKYAFNIPAWEMNVLENLWDRYLQDKDVSYNEIPERESWGNDGVGVEDEDSIEIRQLTVNNNQSVVLLRHPSTYSTSEVSLQEVESTPYIVDGEKGKFGLLWDNPGTPDPLSLPNYYGIKVSYQSGHDLNNQGLMDGDIERAIFMLANNNLPFETIPPTSNPEKLPFADRASEIFQQDRERIWKEEYQVDVRYLNPLGLHYGHFMAWKTIQRKADKVKSSLSNWL